MSDATQTDLGAVVSLLRYPVKSMMGEELDNAEVRDRGVLGDRAYALLDSSNGKVASAKNPSKWPGLFAFRANFIEPADTRAQVPTVRITLPDALLLPVSKAISARCSRRRSTARSHSRQPTAARWSACSRPQRPPPGRRMPKSIGRISKDSITGTPSPISPSQRERFSTARRSIS